MNGKCETVKNSTYVSRRRFSVHNAYIGGWKTQSGARGVAAACVTARWMIDNIDVVVAESSGTTRGNGAFARAFIRSLARANVAIVAPGKRVTHLRRLSYRVIKLRTRPPRRHSGRAGNAAARVYSFVSARCSPDGEKMQRPRGIYTVIMIAIALREFLIGILIYRNYRLTVSAYPLWITRALVIAQALRVHASARDRDKLG